MSRPPAPMGYTSASSAGREPAGTTPRRPSSVDVVAARRTMVALLASALGVLPLKALFVDNGWLIDVWLTMAVVIVPAALIRLRRAPGALDVWPGIVLLIPWLTGRFVSAHAFGGIIPTGSTWHDVAMLMTDLHRTTRNEAAPIHTTIAVRLVICALLGLLAALVDLIAVVGRRGALAGVPLLIVYTVAGAVPRQPVSWVWFVFAAAAFLLLLAIDAGDDLRTWGVRIATPGAGKARTALAATAQRIAAAAVVVAVLLPLLVPGDTRNLIANAFHNNGGDGISGFGEGSGTGGISPFVALQGQLNRTKPVDLFTVHMTRQTGTQPFYLRYNVLSKYTTDGFKVDDHGTRQSLSATDFDSEPTQEGGGNTTQLAAQIKISGLTGTAPIFTLPSTVNGVDADSTWSPKDQLLLNGNVRNDQTIVESFSQLTPTADQLANSPAYANSDLDPLTQVPGGITAYVRGQLDRVIAGRSTPYGRARAISDYFSDPDNDFTYDVQTKPGDSKSALENFLRNRVGYCQQYAAAMTVMMREAGIPSRVVLGYMHDVPDRNGNFTVTTADAHAWVESYFEGIGWVPFDPTPTSGLAGGQRNDLAYAPHVYPSTGAASANASTSQANLPNAKASTSAAAPQAGTDAVSTQSSSPLDWWPLVVAVVVLALVLTPAGVREARRRRRYGAGRRAGDTDALWAELSDTALDLGYVWSDARSPRQVAEWLADDAAGAAPSLRALAVAVEHRRYSLTADGAINGVELAGDLRKVTGELRARRSGRTRLLALVWPASLRWSVLRGVVGDVARAPRVRRSGPKRRR